MSSKWITHKTLNATRRAVMFAAHCDYRIACGRKSFSDCLRRAWASQKAHDSLLAACRTNAVPAPASRRLYSRESGRRAANFAA